MTIFFNKFKNPFFAHFRRPSSQFPGQKKFFWIIPLCHAQLHMSFQLQAKRLVFNDDKTKLMLFSTTQLSQKHNLNSNELFRVMHNGKPIERVNTKKILGIHFDENLSWSYHANNVIQSYKSSHLEVFVNLNVLHPIRSVNRPLKL